MKFLSGCKKLIEMIIEQCGRINPVVTLPFLQRLHNGLSTLNDFLLIPMIASIILELSEYNSLFVQNATLMDYIMNLSFFMEWFIGFVMSSRRGAYLVDRQNLLDLVSCLPFGVATKCARLFRLIRVIRIFRVLIRAKRYSGPVREIARMLFLVGTILCVGAYTILLVEPEMVTPEGLTEPSFEAAMWWAIVTISTVGYGDLYPSTFAGRMVAVPLITVGVGVFGYVAGVMTQLLNFEEETSQPATQADMKRLESKLDRLAAHLGVEWGQDDAQESG